jgi:hypothetical protein
MIGDEYIINNIETYNNLEKNNNYSIKNIFNYFLSKCFI